ncbi:Di-glucose binding protein with Kinesin motor domain-containing protein [Perilla frutescens var. hirtella]|uniref:Di-glucose binding protein with Kinesin motor domain-containing protein n=1 Tax=Perilla frutescens var. hirtella TaxID=608512 RepID=A0AAD4PFQ7_PERFH|nr:Di-glucose binding protein with Kinesin motor domain-containing protein [Perilla frutescens var. hirtella]
MAGVSVVLRDDHGTFITARTCHFYGQIQVEEGEAIGLLEALSWIKSLNMSQVIFENDSKVVHDVVRSSGGDLSEFGSLIDFCRALLNGMPSCSLSLVRRSVNVLAHRFFITTRMKSVPLSMAEFEWNDPLLITDVSSLQNQDQSQTHCKSPFFCRLGSSIMETLDDSSPANFDGRLALGFSLTSPDLVCAGSPVMTNQRYEESPECLVVVGERVDVSLENGIEGSEMRDSFEAPAAKMEDLCAEASFELVTTPLVQESLTKPSTTAIGINVGSTRSIEFDGGLHFSEDSTFNGGDTVRTEDPIIGNVEGLSLYQTARFGEFSYHFQNLEAGNYVVDLHFAEIVFTAGPPGMRVFDVFLQGQKVVSCLDIYAKVGSHVPLVISDLKTCIDGDDGLSIRFEGVIGSPIVSGIFIRKYSSGSFDEVELSGGVEFQCLPPSKSLNEKETCSTEGDLLSLQAEHELQKKELSETKKFLEELKMEYELKSRECQEAWKSLKELQNELMRKSMHVGSLAFAIEGQVKEKGKWFSSLQDLTRKLKILKMEHIALQEDASLFKQYVVEMEGVNSILQSTMNKHVQLHEDMKIKFLQEVKEKKELYNRVLELKGNIRVFCRCRPMNSEEIDGGASMAVDFEAAKDGEITVKSNGISRKTFKFDAVFSPEADQSNVFEETSPLATSVLDGYNVCIFAYGQTGTGKTFTMEGTNESRGVNYRTLEKLFHIIEERKSTFQYEVSVSVLEVYNEQIRDLLVLDSQPCVNSKRLEIKQVGDGGHHVPGLVEAHVKNVSEVWEVLRTGSNGRAVGSTNANEHSSRSHCMHCVMVKGENLLSGECTRSKLWLVDLAGSERIAKTEVQGERLKETQNINRSLSALGDVISALATRSPHIPFRNSKLTHLLQDSLGGDSKTLMFVQISPNENDLTESLCSLNFASRVRGIELGPAKKQMDKTELFKYKQMVEKLKQDMKSKDFQVRKLEDTNYGLEVKVKERDVKARNLQEKIKELESQLLVERKLARQHVDSKIAEQLQQHRSELVKTPITAKMQGASKSQLESKDQTDVPRLSAEEDDDDFSFCPIPVDGFARNDLIEKENIPEMAQQLRPPKQTGRASACPTVPKIYATPSLRRHSLIPQPTLPGSAKLPTSFLPLTPIQANKAEDCGVEVTCLPEQITCDSPKDQRNRSKKLSSALRRSLHKKMNMKSPMQPPLRRIGVNVGMEKVRVSIGGRGKMGQRVLLGNARRTVKDVQQKQSHREKERGWNIGTTSARTLL